MRKFLLFTFSMPLFVLAQTTSSIFNKDVVSSTGEIYNGREHVGYLPSITGTAYYPDNDWQPGTLVYSGVLYSSVFLKYDLLQNEVIIRHFNNITPVTLFTPRVQSFSLGDRKFIQLTENSKSLPPPGIYHEVQKGKMSLYIRRSKFIHETTSLSGIERRFLSRDSYYIVKDGICYPVKKRKDVWSLVKNKKGEIRSMLKKKGISYRGNTETALVEIVTYYNEAIN